MSNLKLTTMKAHVKNLTMSSAWINAVNKIERNAPCEVEVLYSTKKDDHTAIHYISYNFYRPDGSWAYEELFFVLDNLTINEFAVFTENNDVKYNDPESLIEFLENF